MLYRACKCSYEVFFQTDIIPLYETHYVCVEEKLKKRLWKRRNRAKGGFNGKPCKSRSQGYGACEAEPLPEAPTETNPVVFLLSSCFSRCKGCLFVSV